MKTLILAIAFQMMIAPDAFADLNDNSSVVVNLSYRGTGRFAAGAPATIDGTITAVNKDSNFWNLWKWNLKESLQKRGLDIVATFPDDSTDVTSSITFQSIGKNQIKFSFQTKSLKDEDLNRFALRVYDNQGDRKKIATLLSIQTKLERRLDSLTRLRDEHRRKRVSSAAIAILSAEIDNLESLIDKLRAELNSDANLVADFVLPLQVGNRTTGPIHTSTKTDDFKLELASEPGILIAGMKPSLKMTFTRLGRAQGKDFYLPQMRLDGTDILSPQATNFSSNPATYLFTSASSPVSNKNHSAEIFLYEWDAKKQRKKDLEASLAMPLPVLADDVAPTWLANSTPSGTNKYLKDAEPIALVVDDSFGRIDLNSLTITLTGQTKTGQGVSKTIGNLIKTDLGEGEDYLISGDIGTLEEGRYLLKANIQDGGSNLAAPTPWSASFQIDKTAPVLSFTIGDNQTVQSPNFTVTGQITDLSPTRLDLYQNSQLVTTSPDRTINFSVILQEGKNTFELRGSDAAGNIASPTRLESIHLDSTPTQIISSSPADGSVLYTNHLPIIVPISIATNEPLSSALANEQTMIATESNTSFHAQLSIDRAGPVTFDFSFEDLWQNQMSKSISIDLILDQIAPQISASLASPSPTNLTTAQIPIVIADDSPTVTRVLDNGNELFQTFSKSFTAPVLLESEGLNRIEILSTDAAGNQSQPVTLDIVRDTTPPTIQLTSPQPNTRLGSVVATFTGTANKPLKKMSVEGQTLALNNDKTGFSGDIVLPGQGIHQLQLEAEDLVGNKSNLTLSVEVKNQLLVPQLVSVRPLNSQLFIVGAAGSTRGGSIVSASSGFLGFNSSSGKSSDNGAFILAMNPFTEATLKVVDGQSGEEASMTLTFSQGTRLSGTIRDVFDNPLPNVTISIEGTTQSLKTSGTGTFAFENVTSGDQVIVIDPATIPQAVTGPNRTFSKTKISMNIGYGQDNIFPRPIYLTPLLRDGSETIVTQGASVTVTSDLAPGVELRVPANSTVFPGGQTSGSINVMTINSDRSLIPPPEAAQPATVVSLEPSGLHFSEPVPLTLPNDYELPPKTDMIILSLNSSTGTWEVDGISAISADGTKIESKPGQGISHFSTVFAVPMSPILTSLQDPSKGFVDPNTDVYSTEITLPSFMEGDNRIAPSLKYKTTWARPTAFVSQLISIPEQRISFQTRSTSGQLVDANGKALERYTAVLPSNFCKSYLFLGTKCFSGMQEYLYETTHDVTQTFESWYRPSSIRSQFIVQNIYSNSIQFGADEDDQNISGALYPSAGTDSPQILTKEFKIATLEQFPETNLVSYAVELKDSSGNHLPSGLYPSLARYEIKMKNLTLTSRSGSAKTKISLLEGSNQWSVAQADLINAGLLNLPKASLSQTVLDQILPKDALSDLLVQNKVNSSAGRGWQIAGAQRILNPNQRPLVVEEEDGSASLYAPSNVISTYYKPSDSSISLDSGVDMSNPNQLLITRVVPDRRSDMPKHSTISQVIPNSNATPQDLFEFQANSGTVGNQGYYDCEGRAYTGSFDVTESIYRVLPKLSTVLRLQDGSILSLDSREHALYRQQNGVFQKLAGTTIPIDALMEYPGFNMHPTLLNQFCSNAFGQSCGTPQLYQTHYCSETKPADCPPGFLCKPTLPKKYIESAGVLGQPNYSGDNQTGLMLSNPSNIGLNNPTDLIQLPDGSLLVADSGNNRVRRVNLSTNSVNTYVGNGSNTAFPLGGSDTPDVSIFHPQGLVADGSGTVYISTEAGLILKVTPERKISRIAGLPLGDGGTIGNQGQGSLLYLNQPYGLALDEISNELYVAETGANRVWKLNLLDGQMEVIAGNGSCDPSSIGDGIPAATAGLCRPTKLALDTDRNLLILDPGHNAIRKVILNRSLSGAQTFLAANRDQSTLLKNVDNTWVRLYRNGSRANFDSAGRQTQLKDPSGISTDFQYDDSGRLQQVTLPSGRSVSYNYNSSGLLTQIADPSGRTTSFEYNGNQLSHVSFPDGSAKEYQYDASGLLIKEINERGFSTAIAYDDTIRLKSITLPDGTQISASDYVSRSAVQPDGSVNSIAAPGLSGSSNRTTLINSKGIQVEMSVDQFGQVALVKDELGNISKIRRDDLGRVIRIDEPTGAARTFTFSQNTNDVLETKEISPTGEEHLLSSRTYNSLGDVVTEKDLRGNTTTFQYDGITHRLSSASSPGNVTTSFAYNSKGWRVSKSTSRSILTETESLERNSAGFVTKVTGPGSREKTLTYDQAGNPLSVTTKVSESIQTTIQYQYDSMNRLKKVISPNGEVTEYSYLPTGQLARIIDPKGKQTTFDYDRMGRLLTKTNPLGNRHSYAYDDHGNLETEVDPNNNTKRYQYDSYGRVSQIIFPDDTITYAYDQFGNVQRLSNTVSQIEYQRDYKYRVTSEVLTGIGTAADYPRIPLSVSYDDAGVRASLASPQGGLTFTRDNLGKLTQLANSWGDSFTFGYDSAMRPSSVLRPGSRTDFSYSADNLLESIIHSAVGQTRSSFTYGYDRRGMPTQKRAVPGDLNYSYDLNGQLIGVTGLNSERFDYDSLGNRTSDDMGTYTYDQSAQRLLEDWQYTYQFDNNGNLILKIPKSQGGKAYQYIYSSKNQLTGVRIFPSSLSGDVLSEMHFKYDALGRRLRKTVTDNFTPSKSFTRNYVYDGDNVLLEFGASNNLLARYTHSPLAPDDILSAEITSEGVSAGLATTQGRFYFAKDALGSVADILNVSGSVIQHMEYASFGKILAIKNSSGQDISASPQLKTSYAFAGREWDEEIGLYYNRARYYDPQVGRFLQQDPHPGNTGIPITVVNKYAYVGNNPLGRTDPTGLSWLSDFFGGSGGFVGDLITAVATTAILVASGVALGPALIAVASVAGGALVASMAMAASQGGDFWSNTGNNFHSFFRVGATFLAGSALAADAFGGGVAGAGGNGLQGYVLSQNPYFGGGTGLTIGSASTYDIGSGFAAHEFSHTLQFIGISALTKTPDQAWGAYLAVGALGAGLRFGGVPDSYNPIEFYH